MNQCRLPGIPFTLSDAGSAVLSDNTIMICGGLRDYKASKQCSTLTSQGWSDPFEMVSKRYSL